MGRLSLVIADYDAEYIRNFGKYLITNYPGRFELASFSSPQALNDFLESSSSVDIVLVNSQMYDAGIGRSGRELLLLLAEGGRGTVPQCPEQAAGSVMKYQHMDRLVSEILRLYAVNTARDHPVHGRKNTFIVSAVSPAGGTGKSSIAAGCSIMCAGRGYRAFYLNLENSPSTERFFRGESNQSFSNVLYHLKGSGSLWLRLESARCPDARSGVHFFKPPESMLEMNELEEQDVVRLIREFRSSCVYDMVFVDLSTGLSNINAEVMRHSDIVLLVLVQDPVMEIKADVFSRGLDLLESRRKTALADKLLPVLNFASGYTGCGSVYGYRPAAVIPDCTRMYGNTSVGGLISDVSFLTGLNSIVDRILAGRPPAGISGEGGGSVA